MTISSNQPVSNFTQQNKTANFLIDRGLRRTQNTRSRHQQYFIMMFGGPILWSVKKHNHAGRSSTDNEYMAQSHACTAVMWVRGLLEPLRVSLVIARFRSELKLINESLPSFTHFQLSHLACD